MTMSDETDDFDQEFEIVFMASPQMITLLERGRTVHAIRNYRMQHGAVSGTSVKSEYYESRFRYYEAKAATLYELGDEEGALRCARKAANSHVSNLQSEYELLTHFPNGPLYLN